MSTGNGQNHESWAGARVGQGPTRSVFSSQRNNHCRIRLDKHIRGFTLVELILVVALLAVLAGIVVPRMGVDVIGKVEAKTAAAQFGNYLRLARSLAITNASSNGQGYKVMLLPSEPYTSYRIVNAQTLEDVKEPREIPQGVVCSGDAEFRFMGLGDLAGASQKQVQFSKEQETLVVTVWPAGGRIKVTP